LPVDVQLRLLGALAHFAFLAKFRQNDILCPLDVYQGIEKTLAFAGIALLCLQHSCIPKLFAS
jgi:hypothetical protein